VIQATCKQEVLLCTCGRWIFCR